ncbi:MAG TPA: uracil-DNA glycosylase, partial [Thermoanaerobaculia bacterium]|nr:uracil-DNA glycosylase [Thermoanaerobaculia bacterium]
EACRACPRLVAWREESAARPPRRFAGEAYWARPVPGFGDPAARLLIVGLAPAAHGGNRTGRVFTGDSSGDFLFAGLHRAGFASQPDSIRLGDGLALTGAYVLAPVRCAPPANRPTPEEFDRCRPFFVRELALLPEVRVLLALGGLAWASTLRVLGEAGAAILRPAPAFGHGAVARIDIPGRGPVTLLGSYHVSRQNTNTGRLTAAMFDRVLERALESLTSGL